MSDKIEVLENCVKMQRLVGGKERGKKIILSKPAFILLTEMPASVCTSWGATFSPSSHFFPSPFLLRLTPKCRVTHSQPSPHSKAPHPCCIRPTFMTAAALHSRRLLCPKRVSDKAMNTLSGSSLLVSLHLAGHKR